jgi:hypothetical protein
MTLLITEPSPRPDRATARRVSRKVRQLRAPLFKDTPDGCVDPERFPLSLKDLLLMNDGDLSDVVENEESLQSAASRLTKLDARGGRPRLAGSAYHRAGGRPHPDRDDASAWTTDDHGLIYTASFPAQSRLFHYATVPVIAVCSFKDFCPNDRVYAAQALEWLIQRDVRSAAEMAHFRGIQNKCMDLQLASLNHSFEELEDVPDKRQYQQSLTCPVVVVSLAAPRRWTLSICDGETANHDLFVDWIDNRIVSVSGSYRDDIELKDIAPPALPAQKQQA